MAFTMYMCFAYKIDTMSDGTSSTSGKLMYTHDQIIPVLSA